MYNKLLQNFSDNDQKIYDAIKKIMDAKEYRRVDLRAEEEFHLDRGEDTVKRILLEADEGIPGTTFLKVECEADSDGEEFELSLTDDTLTQTDKLQILLILENRFGTVEELS